MRKIAVLLLLTILVASCDRSGNSASSSQERQPDERLVPPHALRDQLLGAWGEAGEVGYEFEKLDSGDVVMNPADTRPGHPPLWEAVVNNIRWEGDRLHFDQYMYYVGQPIKRTSPDESGLIDAISGMRMKVVFFFVEDADALGWTVQSKDMDEPHTSQMTRIE